MPRPDGYRSYTRDHLDCHYTLHVNASPIIVPPGEILTFTFTLKGPEVEQPIAFHFSCNTPDLLLQPARIVGVSKWGREYLAPGHITFMQGWSGNDGTPCDWPAFDRIQTLQVAAKSLADVPVKMTLTIWTKPENDA
jgi:hypothetical protein